MDMTKAALMGSANKYKGEDFKTQEITIDDENDKVMHPDDYEVEVGDYEEEINNGNWKGNDDVHKIANNSKKHEYVEEEGKYYQKYFHYFKGVRQCTKVIISKDKFDSETKPKNDLSIMPPPPSPAWKRIATPKRESSFLKSPYSSTSYPDLFPDENLTECQAVPSHLFSPMRQAELGGGRIPRYQEIPLDYPQPRSVDSTNLDSWLNSPGGPATPGGRATPGLPAILGGEGPATPGGRAATPGLPAFLGGGGPATPGGRASPGLPAFLGGGGPATPGGRATPGLPAFLGGGGPAAQGGRANTGLQAFLGGGGQTTPGGRATPGIPSFLGGKAIPGFPAPPRLPSTTGTQATPSLPTVPTPGAHATPSVARRPAPPGLATPVTAATTAVFQIGQEVTSTSPVTKAHNEIDDRLELLAKNAEKDKNLKSEVFRQMNKILNEETINSEKLNPIKKIVFNPASKNVKEARAVGKPSPKKPDEIISRGSWRFSSEHSFEPFVPVVKVKNDSLTRPMVLKKNYDYYEPIVKAIIKKEGSKKHKLKDENKKTFKKQKVEEAPESLVPLSKKVNFMCKDCSKRCSSLRDVKAHLCFPKVQCEDCKPEVKNFQNRRLLLLHLSHSHPAVGQRFACQYCEKGASNKTYLREHVKKFHPKEYIEIYGGGETIVEHSSNEVIVTSLDAAEHHSNEIETEIETENERGPETEEGVSASSQYIMDDDFPIHEPVESGDMGAVESGDMIAVESGGIGEFTGTFEEDIDAPDSVVNTSQDSDEVVEAIPLTYTFHCEKCKKGFHTSIRHRNHKKNCVGRKKVSIVEEDTAKTAVPQHQKLAVTGRRSGKSQARRKNARFEQLKTNWSELMEGRERCGKCGRNNYAQYDLEKHKRVCRGTLLDSSSKYICPHCTHPSRVFNTENAMRRHVSTNHAKEAMEDEWDYLHDEKDCNGMAMARKHLFR